MGLLIIVGIIITICFREFKTVRFVGNQEWFQPAKEEIIAPFQIFGFIVGMLFLALGLWQSIHLSEWALVIVLSGYLIIRFNRYFGVDILGKLPGINKLPHFLLRLLCVFLGISVIIFELLNQYLVRVD